MGLIGDSEDECYVCGKNVDEDNKVEKDGKKFCCEKCEEKYEQQQEEQEEVCQFC